MTMATIYTDTYHVKSAAGLSLVFAGQAEPHQGSSITAESGRSVEESQYLKDSLTIGVDPLSTGESNEGVFGHKNATIISRSGGKSYCDICAVSFNRKSTYVEHCRIKHSGTKTLFTCTCGKMYEWRQSYWRHIQSCPTYKKE